MISRHATVLVVFLFGIGPSALAQTPPPALSVFRHPDAAAMSESLARGDPNAALLGRSRGVDMNIRGSAGQRPIHYVTQYAHDQSLGSLRSLIGAGADVNSTDDLGRTPLGIAAERASAEAVNILLGSGADPRIKSAGHLPISVSISKGNRASFEALAIGGSPLMGADFHEGGAAADLVALGQFEWASWLAARGLVNARAQSASFWRKLCLDPGAKTLRSQLSTQAGAPHCP